MKKIIVLMIKLTARLSLVIYPYSFEQNLDLLLRKVYTFRMSFLFKGFGNSLILGKFSLLKGARHIIIGNNVSIGKHVTLTAFDSRSISDQTFSPEIKIGDGTVIGDFSHITCINNITIGNNVLMGKNILITDNSHGIFNLYNLQISPMKRVVNSKGPIIISDNVWIGEKSSILPGVTIGKGSIVGANSVVTKNVPEYCIVAGIPAVIKNRL